MSYCEDCNRKLEPGEKRYCPSCLNLHDKQQKNGASKALGAVAVIGAVVVGLAKILGGGKNKT